MTKYAILIVLLVACKGGSKTENNPFGPAGSGRAGSGAGGAGSGAAGGSAAGSAALGSAAPKQAGSGSAVASANAKDPWGNSGSASGSGAGSGSAEPKAPSTGKEMPVERPVMTEEQAGAIITEAVTAFGQPNAPCEAIVDRLGVAIPIAFAKKFDKSAIPALTAYGKCAQRIKKWRASIRAAR